LLKDTPPRSNVDAMTSPQTCPLCGGANACAVVACGTMDAPCWCRSAVFTADLLAQVPEAQRGVACICARCAAAAALQALDHSEKG
jgi:hypothetical protein